MEFQNLILWSEGLFSHLPWRKDRTLYRTLVSEIMLQQTTVQTVLNHFERFVLRFPNIKSLAKATEEELLIEWKGLGYYRRAKNLKKIAEQIENNFKGKIPEIYEELMSLNGVGPYTANAILGIGLDQKKIALDANLERVLSRFYGLKIHKGPKLTSEIYQLFIDQKILKKERHLSFRALNEALMDLGRVHCRVHNANCISCPLKSKCIAHKERSPLSYPMISGPQKETKKEKHELKLLRILKFKKNKILCYQKKDGEWLAGQWEIPTFIMESSDDKISQYPFLNKKIKTNELKFIKTTITKYSILNYIYLENESEKYLNEFDNNRLRWKEIEPNSNFSTATLKILKKITNPEL
jgi:A/G-specific adenine glycosylase